MKARILMLILFANLALLGTDLESAQAQNPNIRVEDPTFERQNLQTGETFTIQGTFTAIIIEGLGAILIVSFIVIYAIKKRRKNDNS
jgi:hypothetical protein